MSRRNPDRFNLQVGNAMSSSFPRVVGANVVNSVVLNLDYEAIQLFVRRPSGRIKLNTTLAQASLVYLKKARVRKNSSLIK